MTVALETESDRRSEGTVRDFLAGVLKCEITKYPALHEVDCYAHRDGRLKAHIEIKCRSHAHTDYKTVYLSVRKWWALVMHSKLAPAFYCVAFTDCVGLIDVHDVVPERVIVSGRTNDTRRPQDIEPILEVPVRSMKLYR